jgi:hypothetical protein
MFGRYDRAREIFTNRFEADGDGFLYRSSPTAAPIRVTAAERDRFLSDLDRRLRWLYWGMMAATVVGIGGYAGLAIGLNLTVSSVPLYAVIGMIFVAYMAVWYWIWTAPRRELEGRATLGRGRTKDEARRAALARLTWGHIGGLAALMLVLMLRIVLRNDVLHGWNRLWLVLFGAAFVAIAFAVWRKWRFDRRARAANDQRIVR